MSLSLPSHRTPAALLGVIGALAAHAAPLAGQGLDDVSRLAGVERLAVRAEAAWDDAITMSAGGATADQFLEALSQTFRAALVAAENGPTVADDAATTVTCHVDTYYETGLIVYSLRAQLEVAGADGRPVVSWMQSWVGSFSVQQLHLMFTLGEQCADSFLEGWRRAN